jgi:hypothetical protein
VVNRHTGATAGIPHINDGAIAYLASRINHPHSTPATRFSPVPLQAKFQTSRHNSFRYQAYQSSINYIITICGSPTFSSFFSLVSLPSQYTMSIASFNPFSLKISSQNSETAITIQEIIDYAESRFRAILTHITNETNATEIDRTSWVGKLLRRELVSNSS